jgi:acetyl-CoA carboxylase carboxyl transferase subunit beta
MNWFDRMRSGLRTRSKRDVPEGLWSQCKRCGNSIYQNALERNHWICTECGSHFRIGHGQYLELLADNGTFEEINANLKAGDPLRFRDKKSYPDHIRAGQKATGLNESIFTGLANIGGHPVALGIMNFSFIGGSLGGATGEKIARLIDRAIADQRSLILVCQSGGARMQESTYSLMQMAKVSAKLNQYSRAGGLYLTVLTDPTYGGVTASFAMLGDVILAEPGARVGFAGQPVIKQFMGGAGDLPEGFQIAETVLKHGFIDRIVPRNELAQTLGRLIALLGTSNETSAA